MARTARTQARGGGLAGRSGRGRNWSGSAERPRSVAHEDFLGFCFLLVMDIDSICINMYIYMQIMRVNIYIYIYIYIKGIKKIWSYMNIFET